MGLLIILWNSTSSQQNIKISSLSKVKHQKAGDQQKITKPHLR